MPTAHHRLGPSKSKQWTACTASIRYIEENSHRIPRGSSKYADEGTKAHEYGEQVLRGQLALSDVPSDFRLPVGKYAAACQALITPHSQVFIERSVPLFYNPEDPDARGTVDFAVVSDNAIHIRDYKHGEGVLVVSDYNMQLAIYAQSIIEDLTDAGLYDFSPSMQVTIHAIQPRHKEWVDEPWVTTVGELWEFCYNEIVPPAKLILSEGKTSFNPSEDACRFCEAKGFCPARAQALNNLPSSINPLEVFEDLTGPDPMTLTEQQLLSIYENSKAVIAFIGDVEKYLFEMALSGKPLEGTKLVQGRMGNRKWGDDSLADSALAALGLGITDRYKQSLKSVTEIEKVIAEKQIDADISGLVDRSPGKPVLALAGDKRPAIDSPVGMLENLDSPS
jgi:hypothetical protein